MKFSIPPMGVIHCKHCKNFAEFTDEYKQKHNADGNCMRMMVEAGVGCDEDVALVHESDYCSWAVYDKEDER